MSLLDTRRADADDADGSNGADADDADFADRVDGLAEAADFADGLIAGAVLGPVFGAAFFPFGAEDADDTDVATDGT